MQKYNRIYSYIDEYFKFIYDYYAEHGIAYPVTYYNLDVNSTIWDKTDLFGGYYERIGDLTGVRWNKILLLPIFHIGETTNVFEGDETGYINKGEIDSVVIPSIYGITPYPNDIIAINRDYLNTKSTPEDFPIFTVTGVQKQSPQERTWWKLNLKIEQSRREMNLIPQVSNNYTFFDYTKKIYKVEDAISMTKMMLKNKHLEERINEMVDQNSGFLFC